FHRRNETVPAGQHFCVFVDRQQTQRFVQRLGSKIIKRRRNHKASGLACWIARQIRYGLSGRSRWWIPSGERASRMALAMAGAAPIVPASPTPLIPIGLLGDGVTVLSIM